MYTCPMHPEIRQDTPGRCPKCGMALVLESQIKPPIEILGGDKGLGKLTWASYVPLTTIFSLLTVSTAVISWGDYTRGAFSLSSTLSDFMAGFFLVFASFKLMDLKGFAEGYSTYDLLAQKWFGYGYVYPFIELLFGFAMLARVQTPLLLWAEVMVMVFSGIGVSIKLVKGEEFQCACLGTFLKVPLTKITLFEDFGMAILALILIFLK